jgi:hypothetical protein
VLSKIDFLGTIPGSVNPVNNKQNIVVEKRITFMIGRAGLTSLNKAGETKIKYGMLTPKIQPQVYNYAGQSSAGPVMQTPKQQKRL